MQMHEVYSNAYVTIVAASAKDCDEGFLHLRRQLPDDRTTLNIKAFSLPYRFRDGTFDEVIFQPFQTFQPSLEPINKRGWTLQENLLSTRLLIYGSQLVRQCHGVSATEFGLQWTILPRGSGLGSAPREPPLPPLIKLPSPNLDNLDHLQQLQNYWIEVVNDYSERKLRNVKDKLIAISAIARQLSSTAFRNHSYTAGLWLPNSPTKTSLLYDLCWEVKSPVASQQGQYLAPSWSWASGHVQTSSGVRMEQWSRLTEPFDISQTCEIVECSINSERGDPFSHVLGGSLTIRGPLRKSSVLRAGKNKSSFEVMIAGNKRTEPSELDRLLSFVAANPLEKVDLSRASTTREIIVYDLWLSASFDAITPELRDDPISTPVWCLRLLRDAGLLLRPISGGLFHRIGTFHERQVFRDIHGGSSLLDGCFDPLSIIQVTIL